MRDSFLALLMVIGLMFSWVACDDTWSGLKKDTKENTAVAKEKAKDAHLDETAKEVAAKAKAVAVAAGEELKEATGKVAAKAEEAGSSVASEAKGATAHVEVKAALAKDDTLNGTHIDVDEDADTATLVLKGTVTTLEQRVVAERVAREHAHGMAVRNELRIAG
jgi:hypothetical protein